MRFKVYKDKAGEWRWRLWSGSRIIADSGEGYTRRSSCLKMVNRLSWMLDASVEVVGA